MRGPSKKNTAFIKRSLTPQEEKIVEQSQADIREMWKSLYARNKWKHSEPEEKSKKKLRRTT
jgi:hypothetical protein